MHPSSPLVTFVILCYNQEEYVRLAIQGAFAQDYPRLQIIISDDGSRDRTFEIAQDMAQEYRGTHEVICRRNEQNLGIAGHINKINSLAQGELIIVAAADDISMPNRTARLVGEYLASGRQTNYFYSSAREMSLDGTEGGIVVSPGAGNAGSRLRSALSPFPLAIGATQAWTKLLTTSFEPIGSRVWAEDQILGFRGILLGDTCYIDEPLVRYRVGGGISTRKQPFKLKTYFKGKLAGIHIFVQRFADSVHVGRFSLAVAIAAKVLILTASIPFDPALSAFRKLIRGARRAPH